MTESNNEYTEKRGLAADDGALAWTNPATGEVHLSVSRKNTTDGIHEFQHGATRGGILMSKYAKDLYGISFKPTPGMSNENIEYMKNPTERDARKKQLEYDMEKLGIKKYGEKFTPKHLEELIKYKKLGKLNTGSVEFLETTDQKYLEPILNSIAINYQNNKGDTA